MNVLIKLVAAAAVLVFAVSACARVSIAEPASITATPSITMAQHVDDPMPKAYFLVMSHGQVANASGSIVDDVIVIYVEFVQGLSQQEQRSTLEELAQQCADTTGMMVELTVVDDAGELD